MIERFYELSPYEFEKEKKSEVLTKELLELTTHHKSCCSQYANFLNAVHFDENNVKSPADIPFFPVRLFKDIDL